MGDAAFRHKLAAASRQNDSLLCVGLDPVVDKLPEVVRAEADPVLRFGRDIIEATADLVCAYKPNFAFYGALGESGWRTLKSTLECVPPEIPVILDAKVGDIGSTAEQYARMFYEQLGADALTVNPYMGHDAVAPFLAYGDRGVFLLCLTSNPGSADFQTLPVHDELLYQRVARQAVTWNTKTGNCGLVVGATRAEMLRDVRGLAPGLPLLIPGVGAQGGDLEATVANGQDADGGGFAINASRSVIYASSEADFAAAARSAATAMRADINRLRRPATP